MSGGKIRITMTVVDEYVPNPNDYPEGMSVEDMARLDAENIKDDPLLFIERPKTGTSISYEVFE